MALETVDTLIGTVGKYVGLVRDNVLGYYGARSLPDVAKLTRVEPLTIVSRDLISFDPTKDVLNTSVSILAGYYLQAVNIMTKVNDIRVIKILDSLNPNRDSAGWLAASRSMESYAPIIPENVKFKLPTYSPSTALEDSGGRNDGKTTIPNMDEVSNLAVGKMISINIPVNNEDGKSARVIDIPVNVRLDVRSVGGDNVVRVMGMNAKDLSVSERAHDVMSGRIDMIKDFIFVQDLITEYKKAAIRDTSGTLQEIQRRANNAKKYGLLTQNPSLVGYSTIAVISEVVAKDLEKKLGGRLSSPNTLKKAFDNAMCMMLVVVDRESELATFYIRGINKGAVYTFRELVAKNRGTGPDIGDIVKALTMGQPPSF